MLDNFYSIILMWIASVVGGLDLTWLTYYTPEQLEEIGLSQIESPYTYDELPGGRNAVPLTQACTCKYDDAQELWVATAMHDYRPGVTIHVDASGLTSTEAAQNLNKKLRDLKARAEKIPRGNPLGGWRA